MKITRELRREITAAARKHGMGGHLIEVGYRDDGHGHHVVNTLLWPADEDLWDTGRFAHVKDIEDDPANPGCYALDLYVYSERGRRGSAHWQTELETNVYIYIRDGRVVLATNQDLKAKSMAAAIGFPAGKGW
jgi:hypothetical protein